MRTIEDSSLSTFSSIPSISIFSRSMSSYRSLEDKTIEPVLLAFCLEKRERILGLFFVRLSFRSSALIVSFSSSVSFHRDASNGENGRHQDKRPRAGKTLGCREYMQRIYFNWTSKYGERLTKAILADYVSKSGVQVKQNTFMEHGTRWRLLVGAE